MSLHSDRRTFFFFAALAATTVAGCTTDGAAVPESQAEHAASSGKGDDALRTLLGKVSSDRGEPLGGAVITIPDLDLAAVSDSEGRFALENVPFEDQIVQVSLGHYETAFFPVRPTVTALDVILKATAAPWPPPAVKKGLTWVKALHDNSRGQDQVSCHDYTIVGNPTPSPTPTRSCDPYVGDTACNLARPILCLKPDGSGSNGHVWNFYNGWAAGNIGITHPIVGSSMTSLAVANAFCVAEFGTGWRMASHHDGNFGGGWQWRAYGNLNTLYAVQEPGHTLDHRFWVYILEGSGPTPWDPTNPPNDNPNLVPGKGKVAGDFAAQYATAGNCWN